MASGQLGEPLVVNVKNSGSSFIDQFAASTDYAYEIVDDVDPQLGDAQITIASSNTLKVVFTPHIGVTGTTDLIVTYYTLSAPMHPVTRSYHFVIADEVVTAGKDQFIVDVNGIDIPLDVLANDSATGGPIHIATVAVANSGNATVNANGDGILFTPDQDFAGDTWIQYIACDSSGNCGEGKAHILVRDPNAQDNVTFQKFLLNQEKLEILTPFENFDVAVNPAHGTLDSINTSSWVYTPNEGFTGNDTISLSLQNLVIRNYVITVYTKNVNIEAKDDRFYVRPGLSVSFNVLNNDLLDFDISSHTNPTKGVLYEIGNGAFIYTPNTGFRGVDKFTYTTCFSDTVYCETATVLIHVTDLEPDNVFTYKLQTSKDLPLTIDYPIAYTDFSYIVSSEPSHGSLVFNSGVQEIDLPCDTLESYNMLVYTPNAGYTGSDHFEYYYCIEPSNLCYLVKSDVNVIDPPQQEDCACIVDCVWPGDNDHDGRVDMNDLLTLGYKLGETGTPRTYSDPSEWFGQHPSYWPDGKAQYLDANGDGTITAGDVDGISDHYYQTHTVVARDVQQRLPYQFSIIPVQFSLDSGDVVILDIALGNSNGPALDLKGTKFSVNVPPWMLDSASVEVNFHQDSWIAEGAPFISLGKVPWDGRIDAGFAKGNGKGSSGFGVIATVVFIIEDDAEGFKTDDGLIHFPVRLDSGVAMDASGTLYDVDGDETYLTYDTRKDKTDPYKLILYPNPASDQVNIFLNGKTAI
ncbi:MAG TPA: Ig-like domain-containing protein, partial [Saprospiraceae bacterium]|nr:Ig-like domain-containing protein [Saprospiraceae bacterium]